MVSQYQFLVHCTLKDRVASIRSSGLRPFYPGAESGADMNCVYQSIGVRYPPILCFTPSDHRIKYGCVEFAIAAADLPERVGIDWSFSGYWRSVQENHRADPDNTIENIFLRAFREFRSIVTYDSVPSAALRVRVLTSSEDPSTWPMFETVADDKELFISGTSML